MVLYTGKTTYSSGNWFGNCWQATFLQTHTDRNKERERMRDTHTSTEREREREKEREKNILLGTVIHWCNDLS